MNKNVMYEKLECEMRFAAIDIGSNAIRLLLTRVLPGDKKPFFKTEALYRVPIRLGEDVFEMGAVSDEKIEQLVNTMVAFKHLIEAFQPLDHAAFATSAMREAQNVSSVVDAVKRRAGIDIAVIDGRREAEILYAGRSSEKLNAKKNYLLIDVGGGSTQVTLVSKNKLAQSRSFDVGTVRIIQNQDLKSEWKAIKDWLRSSAPAYKPLLGIGSGGNINKIFSLSRKKEGKPLSKSRLEDIYDDLRGRSYIERMKILNLKPDRADVIVPAAKIFLWVMRWAEIKKLYVPRRGLADGINRMLYDRHVKKNGLVKPSAKSVAVADEEKTG